MLPPLLLLLPLLPLLELVLVPLPLDDPPTAPELDVECPPLELLVLPLPELLPPGLVPPLLLPPGLVPPLLLLPFPLEPLPPEELLFRRSGVIALRQVLRGRRRTVPGSAVGAAERARISAATNATKPGCRRQRTPQPHRSKSEASCTPLR